MYTYSFVNQDLMEKLGGNTLDLVPMKNALSEELTHLKGSHIPNLVSSLEKNMREFKELKLMEIEKIFSRNQESISEKYALSGVIMKSTDVLYYEMQTTVDDLLTNLWVDKYQLNTPKNYPSFSHKWRTASINLRGQDIWYIWEIHPKYTNNFWIQQRVAFFEIDAQALKNALYSKVKANDLSEFQANNFDINFVVDKNIEWKNIFSTIQKANSLITKVELVDIYEDEEKLPGKRSLSFKVFIQSMEKTLDDKIKNEVINEIIAKVEKKWGNLR